jgi:hypothetical protein
MACIRDTAGILLEKKIREKIGNGGGKIKRRRKLTVIAFCR